MNYTSVQKNLGHSPRKLRLVADMVRKMSPERAILTLQFTNRAAAPDLAKAIKTALANVAGKSNLSFRTLEINEGLKLGRMLIGTAGRGRSRPFKKRFSHIRVVLTDDVVAVAPKKLRRHAAAKAEAAVVEKNIDAEVVAAAEKPAKKMTGATK